MTWSGRTLQQMTEHVAYEIDMLQEAAAVLAAGTFENNRVVKNALLESVLVHLRSIDDFLQLKAARDDDVIALDYLPSWNPRPALSEKDRADVNKRVQHLTTRRLRGKRQWALALVAQALEVCVEFLQQLERDQPLRAASFKQLGVTWPSN